MRISSINTNMVLSVRPCIRMLFTGSEAASTNYKDLLKRSRYLTEKIQLGANPDPFEANSLIKELINTGHLNDARHLFEEIPIRDEITWTSMIGGYVKASDGFEALVLFSRMWTDEVIRVDQFSLSLALKACGSISELKHGESMHGYSVKTGFVNSVFVGSAILDMYAKAGNNILMARRIFDEMPMRNVVSWTAMITALVRASCNKEALDYFSRMWVSGVECDSYTFAIASKACADLSDLNRGKEIHARTMKLGFDSSSFVANTLATMYNKCGKLDYGLLLFRRMSIQDVVSWTTVIASYVQMGCEENAIQAFLQMRDSGVSPNEFTFAAVVSGCAGLAKIEWGKQLHAHVLCLGFMCSMSVANAIMTMYAKCGCITSASMVFHDMVKKDLVSWSAIIAGYSQEGHGEEAFKLLSQMRREGPKPNEFTLASLLSVCAYMAILDQGKQIHAHILLIGLEHDAMVKSSLITMYSKCGSIEEAKRIFYTMITVDIVSWTAMINGYAEHGNSNEAINLFEKMPTVGLRPDYVTFIGVLTACSHAGLVDLGFHYFELMSKQHRINPGKEHYGCMVDLLGRAGRLTDAELMIMSMPFKPDDVVWSTLLRACRVHGNVDCGKRMAEHILKLEPNCAGTHITLSNIYAARGRWRDAADVRKLMKSKGVKKEPGWSWIKVKDSVTAFVSGDRSHPQGNEIYTMLDLVASRARMAGYVPDLTSLLYDLGD
ncbi:putative pentatricopeptide repeat-containing protein At3g47840 [Magnolia sinica]|uniref:putative pentatricopeptide repeat-containing protein At3g47840 n=1 Tax=Magnolia sinica TaxID=86752 RepID=UPI0026599BE1|nr:putative pentatricopeptide repeat-containing protein At3g47840 [Magnolia sinica]